MFRRDIEPTTSDILATLGALATLPDAAVRVTPSATRLATVSRHAPAIGYSPTGPIGRRIAARTLTLTPQRVRTHAATPTPCPCWECWAN